MYSPMRAAGTGENEGNTCSPIPKLVTFVMGVWFI